jgi:hypothetical protein
MSKYTMLGLYKRNNNHQVIASTNDDVKFEGTKEECKQYIKDNK